MDPLQEALSLFRRRNFNDCITKCTVILEKQPLDQATWCLKMKALTQRVYVDDIESDRIFVSDLNDENVIASAPRPGTSLKVPATTTSIGLTTRPLTSAGCPLTGTTRPDNDTTIDSPLLNRLKTARPFTSQSARAIRIGTAAILSQKEGPFIQISRLNLSKYAKDPCLSKALFEYLYNHEGDVRNAMELATKALEYTEFKDWWWKVQLVKCYIALNSIRDAEKHLRSALKQQHHLDTYMRLIKLYLRLDQPMSAKEICCAGLQVFPNDTSILTELARLNESILNTDLAVKLYKELAEEDAMNLEAIASVGLYHFYNSQPELALKYYRRILSMGAHFPELYNNLGLCCLYSQQLDLTLSCFQRAVELATDSTSKAEIWYNVSHVALAAGDIELALHCLTLCLSEDSNHAPAFNNLAVLQEKIGNRQLAKVHFNSAKQLQPDLPEAKKNIELLEGN
ncbi:tetratricopeptide repeat protein 8 [Agrilus planipennis]|uniref:Tetratricopeptide repeat protein 8 n=1 Tax=Agrilus planipennis TaxID=224129 RepID=A0A1W4X0B7_AGRPL|nr:tetratricopeptide repeat protein 8 [Agrilus planipennis]